MTSVSNSLAALTILSQASSLASNSTCSAADTILDIVSGRKAASSKAVEEAAANAAKAKAAASNTPREAGGTISYEISRAASGAMSAGVVSSFNADDPKIAFRPYEASAENAEGFAKALLSRLHDYNAQFHLAKIPTREEWTALVLQGEADSVARGADPKFRRELAEKQISDEGYQNRVTSAVMSNDARVTQAQNAKEAMGYLVGHVSDTFGVNVQITYDERGEASIGAFEIVAGGQTVRYDGKGQLSVAK